MNWRHVDSSIVDQKLFEKTDTAYTDPNLKLVSGYEAASIVIVDYGVGNTCSVSNAISALGYRKLKISGAEADILNADALILPGVGAFEGCAKRLRERHLDTLYRTKRYRSVRSLFSVFASACS